MKIIYTNIVEEIIDAVTRAEERNRTIRRIELNEAEIAEVEDATRRFDLVCNVDTKAEPGQIGVLAGVPLYKEIS